MFNLGLLVESDNVVIRNFIFSRRELKTWPHERGEDKGDCGECVRCHGVPLTSSYILPSLQSLLIRVIIHYYNVDLFVSSDHDKPLFTTDWLLHQSMWTMELLNKTLSHPSPPGHSIMDHSQLTWPREISRGTSRGTILNVVLDTFIQQQKLNLQHLGKTLHYYLLLILVPILLWTFFLSFNNAQSSQF